MKDTIRNTLLRVVDTISGCYGEVGNMVNLREIEKLCHLESGLEYLKEEKKMESKKNLADFEEGGGLIQLPNENGGLIKNMQWK